MGPSLYIFWHTFSCFVVGHSFLVAIWRQVFAYLVIKVLARLYPFGILAKRFSDFVPFASNSSSSLISCLEKSLFSSSYICWRFSSCSWRFWCRSRTSFSRWISAVGIGGSFVDLLRVHYRILVNVKVFTYLYFAYSMEPFTASFFRGAMIALILYLVG